MVSFWSEEEDDVRGRGCSLVGFGGFWRSQGVGGGGVDRGSAIVVDRLAGDYKRVGGFWYQWSDFANA